MLLATIPGGAVPTPFSTTFVPQFIVVRGITPQDLAGDVTISINVQGDGVVFNLDPDGFGAMSNIKQYLSAAARITTGYVFQLADGLVINKNTNWQVTNADAAALEIHGFSKQKRSSIWLTYLIQTALANSGVDFDKFAYLAVPTAGATDKFSVLYDDGTMDANLSPSELRAMNAYFQSTEQIAIPNIAPARVKLVTYIPVAQRSVYLIRYQSIMGAVDAAAVAKL